MQIFWSHFSENTAHEKGESILIMVAVEAEQEVIVGEDAVPAADTNSPFNSTDATVEI